MINNLHLYEVLSLSSSKFYVYAENNSNAKRAYCKARGVSPSDYWCGASSLRARKLTIAEESAWLKQAEAERDTYTFIKGMLDIGVNAYKANKPDFN